MVFLALSRITAYSMYPLVVLAFLSKCTMLNSVLQRSCFSMFLRNDHRLHVSKKEARREVRERGEKEKCLGLFRGVHRGECIGSHGLSHGSLECTGQSVVVIFESSWNYRWHSFSLFLPFFSFASIPQLFFFFPSHTLPHSSATFQACSCC